jgi:hypothetical protein
MTDASLPVVGHDARAMRALFSASLFISLTLSGCGGETKDNPDAGMTMANACGASGAVEGTECTGMDECGAGNQNFVEVTFCTHCFARADTHVCEAGKCRMLEGGLSDTNVRYAFSLLPNVTAPSFTVASILPVMADGTRVSCASLMKDSCDIDANRAINAKSSSFLRIQGAGDFISAIVAADPGQGRIVYLQLTSGMQGTGEVVARGCAEVDIAKGEEKQVEITLTAL